MGFKRCVGYRKKPNYPKIPGVDLWRSNDIISGIRLSYEYADSTTHTYCFSWG